MRLSSIGLPLAAFAAAALIAVVAAVFSVDLIEDSSEAAVRDELSRDGIEWAQVDANGLQIYLIGTAPNEAQRFRALSTAGKVVDAARVIDEINVAETAELAPPRFSIEILRNASGVSLIGLIPAATDREAMLERVHRIAGDTAVSDLLETAEHPAPEGWEPALDYALAALDRLPRSKISVESGAVAVTAMSDSAADRRRLETELTRRIPGSVRLALDISAPRPVISPFTLRFIIDEGTARFDACSASTEEGRDRILRAATAAGLEGKAECRIGLGVPSSTWPDAVELALAALAELGGASVTFSDADITLIAPEGTPEGTFERIMGDLEANLPEIFSLHAVLPQPEAETGPSGPPEFVATRSPEGLVQLRGRLASETARTLADSFARARFGSEAVYTAARIEEGLPDSWQVRVLAGLDALALLSNGAVTVTPDTVTVSGDTGNKEASDEIARLLAEKLGDAEDFSIDVTYLEKLDPLAALPTPEECKQTIVATIGDRKINFEPGSATPDAQARMILDDVSEVLKECGQIRLEIGGHTDSQGRETMNLELSQARADAILNALRERRVLTSTFTAKGYGETQPIADNDTEEGREANRRIEFRLIAPEPIPEEETTLESLSEEGEEEDATPAQENGDEQN